MSGNKRYIITYESKLICPRCDYKTMSVTGMKLHMKVRHGEKMVEKLYEKPYDVRGELVDGLHGFIHVPKK